MPDDGLCVPPRDVWMIASLTLLQEDEVLDMLAQYESDETLQDGSVRRGRGPPPLTAMPCSASDEPHRDLHTGLPLYAVWFTALAFCALF